MEEKPLSVIRPLSETDKEFIEIDLMLNQRNPKIYELEEKFSNKNRLILIQSINPLLEAPSLCCLGCFKKESQHELIDLNQPIRDIFNKYTERISLEKINYSSHETKKVKEESVVLCYSICPYCGRKNSISFLRQEIPNTFDMLVSESHKYMTEIQNKELNF